LVEQRRAKRSNKSFRAYLGIPLFFTRNRNSLFFTRKRGDEPVIHLRETRLGGPCVLHQLDAGLDAGTVVFSYLICGMNGAAKVGQAAQFLLNALKPFMPLPVRDLVLGPIAFATPILLVQLMELGNLCPQTPDLFLEDS
jgi:hypothetical protein